MTFAKSLDPDKARLNELTRIQTVWHSVDVIFYSLKVKKNAKIRNQYNQVPHLTRDSI